MELFAKQNKLAIGLIAHIDIVISEDLVRDNAFVQHLNSKIVWPWLLSVRA